MGHGEHSDLRAEVHEDDRVGKTGEQCASNDEVCRQIEDTREGRRRILNQRQDAFNLGEELQLEPWLSTSVPRGRLNQLADRLWGEADRTHRVESRL